MMTGGDLDDDAKMLRMMISMGWISNRNESDCGSSDLDEQHSCRASMGQRQ